MTTTQPQDQYETILSWHAGVEMDEGRPVADLARELAAQHGIEFIEATYNQYRGWLLAFQSTDKQRLIDLLASEDGGNMNEAEALAPGVITLVQA